MKLDLQSLTTEPLVYMLMHSGAFVTVLGIVFFFIGLLFGRATWGRYKGQARELRAEAEAMKEEVANLKRKMGDLSVKSGPAVPIITEKITLPKKEAPAHAPVVASTAAVAAPAAPLPLPFEVKKVVEKPDPAPASAAFSPPAAEPPTRAEGNVIKPKVPVPVQPEPASHGNGTTAPASPAVVASPPPTPSPAVVSTLPPAVEPPTGHHASALSAIIAPPPVPAPAPKKEPDSSSLAKDMLVLPEIPTSGLPAVPATPPPVVKVAKPDFDFDPQLGLIYRTKPEPSDDLTALKGVASNLEQRLNTLGVYTYEQIAGWTRDQVREFSNRLAFKDRIEREQWVEQARELLAGRQQAQRQQLEASLAS